MTKAIKKGTIGTLIALNDNRASALFAGARVKVKQRMHFPDALLVELLDEGPYWTKGFIGEVPLACFRPDRK